MNETLNKFYNKLIQDAVTPEIDQTLVTKVELGGLIVLDSFEAEANFIFYLGLVS